MKVYICDKCGKEVDFLIDLCTKDETISVCEHCYYLVKVETLCSGSLAECVKCDKC